MKFQTKSTIIGGIVGFLILWYDFDFFINVGGPEAPISRFIRNLFSVGGISFFEVFVFPMIILILTFSFLGLIIGLLISKTKIIK